MTSSFNGLKMAIAVLFLLLISILVSLVTIPVGALTETEIEPNNDILVAQKVVPGTIYKGALDLRADPNDWFKVFAPRGAIINVTVHQDSGDLNADLEIYYPYIGGQMERKWSRTDFEYETICIISVADQYYNIRVFAKSGSGSYSLDSLTTEAPVMTNGSTVSGNLYNNSYNVIDFQKVWLENRGEDADLLEVTLNKTPIAPSEVAWLNLRILKLYKWNVGIRWYDISWGDPAQEHARAVATETGWYYIRVNAYNGSGHYELDVQISSVPTDGNDRVDDAPLLYGSGTSVQGSLNQALDHKDCNGVYLNQDETLDVDLHLTFPFTSPGIFSVTILEPDLTLVGEWTNYQSGAVDTSIKAHMGPASFQGKYVIIVEAKVGVNSSNQQDLTDSDAEANYTLTISPSGHNSPPRAVSSPQPITVDEDNSVIYDLSNKFHDDDANEGDELEFVFTKVSTFSGPIVDPAPLDVAINGSWAKIEPVKDWSGSGVVIFEAIDRFDARASLFVYFNVNPVNDAPYLVSSAPTIILGEGQELRPLDLDEVFADPDTPFGDFLTYSLEGNDIVPAWIDSSGMLVLGPVDGQGQKEFFNISAMDSEGEEISVMVTVEVKKVDHSPKVRTPGLPLLISLDEDTIASMDLYDYFTDPDPEDVRLRFEWSGQQMVSALLKDDGTLTFHPSKDWWGTEYMTISGIDHSGLSASLDLTVRVDPVGDAPIIANSSPILGSVSGSDGEGFFLASVQVEDLDIEDQEPGRITYNWYMDGRSIYLGHGVKGGPVLSYDTTTLSNGTHDLSLVVRDGHGLSVEGNWVIEVQRAAPDPIVRGPTPTETTVTGGLAFGLWALLGLAFTEPGRISMFKYLWLPLYTKIKKEEILDQFIRGRIFGFIEHNPGANYTQIKRKMGIGNGTLTHHLGMLEKKNFIKAERDGIYKRFYPKNYTIDEDAIELTNIQKDIYFMAKTEPGISQKEIAERLGVSKRVISYHVHLLTEARLLNVEKAGRRHSLTVFEESQ